MKKGSGFFFVCILFFLGVENISAQNVGIGTPTPVARLHVADSNVVFTGALTLPSSPGAPPVTGPGTRLMWYPDKAAFRAGSVQGSHWDRDSVGYYSFAIGIDSKATGHSSVAMGNSSVASSWGATASGSSTASGYAATALGISTATGFNSTAFGNSFATGQYSTSFGISTAIGSFSTALGNSVSKARESTTIGSNNDTADHPDPNLAAASDRIFQIGNGSSYSARNNAMTVLRNG